MSCGIYKIINPKGRIYIGQSISIERRISEYKRLQCQKQPLLFRSLNKYGWQSHIFEIIEECSDELLLERETFWKLHYDVLNTDSLCCRLDGRGGKMSIETCKKMSESHKGKPIHPNSNNFKNQLKRNISQFDLDGNFIKECPTITSANEFYKSTGRISRCLSEKILQAHGFIWKFSDGLPPNKRKGGPITGKSNKNKGKSYIRQRKVLQIDYSGNILNSFISCAEAERIFKCSGIVGATKNQNRTINGFRWIYEDELHLLQPFKRVKIFPVKQYSFNGEFIQEFESITKLKNTFGKSMARIYQCCYGTAKTAYGFVWKSDNC